MFKWIFDPLPDPLQWVALFLGVLAAATVLMRVLEAVAAAPNVVLNFDVENRDASHGFLVCNIFNRPFQNRLLRKLLQRRATTATAQFALKDTRTNQYVVGVPVAALRVEANTTSARVTLLASELPYGLPIILADDDGNNWVYPGRFDVPETNSLNPGRYEVTVWVLYDGGEVCGSQEFEVGAKAYEAFWVNE